MERRNPNRPSPAEHHFTARACDSRAARHRTDADRSRGHRRSTDAAPAAPRGTDHPTARDPNPAPTSRSEHRAACDLRDRDCTARSFQLASPLRFSPPPDSDRLLRAAPLLPPPGILAGPQPRGPALAARSDASRPLSSAVEGHSSPGVRSRRPGAAAQLSRSAAKRLPRGVAMGEDVACAWSRTSPWGVRRTRCSPT